MTILPLEPSASPLRLSRVLPSQGSPSVRSSTSSRSSIRFATGPRKKTPARRTEELFGQILEHLKTEWASIKSLNLGVKSGTGMVDELVLRRVSTWLAELHMLSIAHDTAATKLGQLARRLSYDLLQQFQTLCDITGHEELADYMRLCVYNTSDPFAKAAIDGPSKGPHTRRARAPPAAPAAVDNGRLGPYSGPRPGRDEFIRFAGYLPHEHPLVQQAYQMYLDRLPLEVQAASSMGDDAERAALEADARQRSLRATASIVRQLAEESAASQRGAEGLPLWLDVEARWRATNHTVFRDELLSSPIVVGDPMPLYSSTPEFKKKWQDRKDAEAAAAQMLSSPGLSRPNTRTHRQVSTHAARGREQTGGGMSPGTPGTPGTPGISTRQSGGPGGVAGQGLPAATQDAAPAGGEGSVQLPPLEQPTGITRTLTTRFKPQS